MAMPAERRVRSGAVALVLAEERQRVAADLDQPGDGPRSDLLLERGLVEVGGDHHRALRLVPLVHDREAAERSIELAADFVAKELEGIEIERVEATIGEVGVSRAADAMLEPTRA